MERDIYFDALKGILIILVLLGHFGGDNVGGGTILNTIEYFIYIFHMPIFVFISGYFSKNLQKQKESGFKHLVMYFLFQAAWAVISLLLFRNVKIITHIWVAGPALWYILALSVWRMYLEHMVKLRYVVPVSFIIAVLSSFCLELSPIMAFPRIVGFLPFFLLGYYTDKTTVDRIKGLNIFLSLFALAGVFMLSYFAVTKLGVRLELLAHNYSFTEFGFGNNIAAALTANIIVYALAVIAGIAFMNVCGALENCKWLIRLGKRTLPIYILSSYIQYGANLIKHKFLTDILINDYMCYAYACVWVVITIIILSSDWVVKKFNSVTDKWCGLVIRESEGR